MGVEHSVWIVELPQYFMRCQQPFWKILFDPRKRIRNFHRKKKIEENMFIVSYRTVDGIAPICARITAGKEIRFDPACIRRWHLKGISFLWGDLTDWLSDWQTDWLTGWLTDSGWRTDWPHYIWYSFKTRHFRKKTITMYYAVDIPSGLSEALRLKQNGHHFAKVIFKHFFKVCTLILISIKIVPNGPIDN